MRSANRLRIFTIFAVLGGLNGSPALADPIGKLLERDSLRHGSQPAPAAAKTLDNIPLPVRKPLTPRSSNKRLDWPVRIITAPKTTLSAQQTAQNPVRANPRKSPTSSRVVEADYKSLDRALDPLFSNPMAKSDQTHTANAIRAIYREEYQTAFEFEKKINSEIARKLVRWYLYRTDSLQSSALDIEKFRTANPLWPSQKLLRKRAENALFRQATDSDTVRTFFRDRPPKTGVGIAALAGSYLGTDQEERARSLITKAWRKYPLDKETEKIILQKFGAFLTPKDHRARIDWLLLQGSRNLSLSALRLAPLLGSETSRTVDARAAAVRGSKNAGKLLDALPENVRAKATTQFHQIQWFRRRKKLGVAWQMLFAIPDDVEKLVDVKRWWIERRRLSRLALNSGRPAVAYKIVSEHGSISGTQYIEAQFFAGWIALRVLGNAKIAGDHFLAMRTAATRPGDIASSEYWLGRTARRQSQNAVASEHFSAAAKYPQSFYGRLAGVALYSGRTGVAAGADISPSVQDIQIFLKRDAVKAIAAAQNTGQNGLVPIFLMHLAKEAKSDGDLALLIALARKTGHPNIAVRIAKIGLSRGRAFEAFAYPIDLLPPLANKIFSDIEPALIYSLVAQESEFNPNAISPAGARGLMQLMPGTAAQVARQKDLKFTKDRLTADPNFNLSLGTAYLSALLESFGGSYLLALAAYNAGPTRVDQWIQAFGDPRREKVDPIDWIERLPYKETRNYVKKIMGALQIFRNRLGVPPNASGILRDLKGGSGTRPAASVSVSR